MSETDKTIYIYSTIEKEKDKDYKLTDLATSFSNFGMRKISFLKEET